MVNDHTVSVLHALVRAEIQRLWEQPGWLLPQTELQELHQLAWGRRTRDLNGAVRDLERAREIVNGRVEGFRGG